MHPTADNNKMTANNIMRILGLTNPYVRKSDPNINPRAMLNE